MKVLFIGDIVGLVGREAVKTVLPKLKSKYNPDFIIANGENSTNGRGISSKVANELFELGVHGITMGNHTWDNKDIFDFIDQEDRLIRPANFPEGTPGKGYTVIKVNGKSLVIINLQGRAFLPPLDCPFETVNQIINKTKNNNKAIFVDFHAEATAEKIAMAWYLDGKVSAVVGTHTHVQTNDERILPAGTGYISDVGMVGPRDGVLGMERTAVIQKFLTQLPVRFTVDQGKWHFHAVVIEINESTGHTTKINKIRLNEDDVIID